MRSTSTGPASGWTTAALFFRTIRHARMAYATLAAAVFCLPPYSRADRPAAVQNGQDTVWVRQYHDNGVTDAVFSPDGSLIAAVGRDSTIRLISTATGELVRTIPTARHQFRLVFGTHGEGLYSCGLGSEVYLWDPATGAQKRSYTIGHRIESPTVGINDLSVSQNGRYLVTGAFYDMIVTDLRDGSEVLKLQAEQQQLRANSVRFAPDDSRVIVGSDLGRMYIVDVPSGDIVYNGRPADIIKGGIRYSPDGATIAAGTMSRDGTTAILLLDAATLAQKYRIDVNEAVEDLAFSPAGAYLLSASNNGDLSVWTTQNGTLLRTYTATSPFNTPPGQTSVAVTPDSAYIVSALADNRICLWNARWTPSTAVAEPPSPLYTAGITTDAAGSLLQIHCTLATAVSITTEIIDLRGTVLFLHSDYATAGVLTRTIGISSLAQGMYYCRIRAGEHTIVQPFTVSR